uniref:Uncharacterized protein n=1 Tax=Eutreptiella gymnastica TaxID=73025 RepID=A0A7S4FVX8_9EUGL
MCFTVRRERAFPSTTHQKMFCGTGLLRAVHKNEPLVPQHFLACAHCPRTTRWSHGKALLVPGQEFGEGYVAKLRGGVVVANQRAGLGAMSSPAPRRGPDMAKEARKPSHVFGCDAM